MKRINAKLIGLFSLSLLLLSSCVREPSDSVDQDKIHTNYELFYNANEDITYARATFRFSNALGTKLELAGASIVLFDGEPLSWQPGLAYYEKKITGLQTTGTFEFEDTEGNTYTNAISLSEMQYPADLDTIDRSSSFELIWPGDPLNESETVTLTANGENEGDAKVFFTDDQGANSIILPANKLGEIGDGPGTLFLDYRYVPLITEAPGAGGLITGRYRPVNAEVYFK
ncbi:MAG: hypothetical protein GYB31_14855 [Bacteroidetes bacterium]|nr:hypothetical protein [Bacteroidota bacterium]